MKTQVIFRYWRKSIIALFPYEIADMKGNCLSYQHVGQHGAANYSAIMYESRPALQTEFADLKTELEKLGYKLEVIKKRSNQRFLDAYTRTRWLSTLKEANVLEISC